MKKGMNKKVLFISCGVLLCIIAVLLCIILLKPSYKVSFDTKGGSAIEEQLVKSGDKASEPEAPVKKGYTFKHWENEEGAKYSFQTKVTKDMTLKAVWEANEYTLTYNTNGGDELEAQKVKYGESFTVEIPVRTGYEFMGWMYNSVKFENGIWEYDKDITVDAEWIVEGSGEQASYSVRLIAERSDGSYNDVTDLYARNYGLTGLKGSIGAIVDLRNRVKALVPPSGYIYDEKKSSLVGEIQADGMLELVVCYSYKIGLPESEEGVEGDEFEMKLIAATKISLSDIEWSSSNKKVATIKNGVVTALSTGKTIITAKYNGQTAKCELTIHKKVNLSLPKAEESLPDKKITLQLKAEDKIEESEVVWKSSNPKVATVEKGVVTTVAGGKTRISATYRGQTVTCEVTVYTAYVATESDFMNIYSDLSGYYKVTADITLNSEHSTARGNATFTGLLDFGGHTLTINTKTGSGVPYAFRLFFQVSGGTIRNGHLVSVAGYGAWGGAIADKASSAITENITADIILNGSYAARNLGEMTNYRSAGGLYNYVEGGTVKSCVINIKMPSNMDVKGEYPVTEVSAIGRKNGTAKITLTDCSATLINDYNDDCIHLLAGHSEDALVADAPAEPGFGGNDSSQVSFTMSETEESAVGKQITLQITSDAQIPTSEIKWSSSDAKVATVANGVVTPVAKGKVIITAEYKGTKATCDVTVYTKYIASEADFKTIYDDLSGYYKVTTDITLNSDHAKARNGATFTGLLDFGGHTFTVKTKAGSGALYSFRLFFKVDGGTIRNGHIVASAGYGNWGGAIADNANNAVMENITADVILNATYACRDGSTQDQKRNSGGLFNLVNGGTFKSCVVNVTIPANITITSGYALTDMSAIGKVNGTAPTLTDCSATLANNYNNDGIHLLAGHSKDVVVSDTSSGSGGSDNQEITFSISKTADVVLGKQTILQINSDAQIPASEVKWSTSDATVATVANGVITPVAKGKVTITAEYKGTKASCDVTVYTAYITSDAQFQTIYNDLSGYYKVTEDITLTTSHSTARNGATFTGLLDFGGKTITINTKTGSGSPYAFRMFFKVDGGTIRNGHLISVAGYGNWGGVIADNAANAITENITADIILNGTHAARQLSDTGTKRNAGGLYNLINGGTVKGCTVNVTIPSTTTVTSGYSITDMSAIGKVNGTSPIMTDCKATLVNNYNDDYIQLLAGHTNNVNVTDTAVSGK